MKQLFYHSHVHWPGLSAWLQQVQQWYQQAPDYRPASWPESVHSSIQIPTEGPQHRRLELEQYAQRSRVPTELVSLLQPIARAAADYYALQDLGRFHIQEIWYNAYARSQWQKPHRHTGRDTWLSGVYYAAFDPILHQATRFYHPGFRWDVSELGWPASVTYQPKVLPGTVIVFPSEILHDVPLQDSDLLRVTVSFNVILTANKKVQYD